MEYGKSILNLWNINPDITFLNNGSFGATPKSVLQKQRYYSDIMESNPVEFIIEKSWELLDIANKKLADLVNAKPANISFIENATTAVNSALHFLIFQKKISGEIIYSNHTYPAVINTLKYYEKYSDITLKMVDIPFNSDSDEILKIFRNAITNETKIALIDSISSATSIVFPIESLSELFLENDIITVVDAAHGVACTDLNLQNAKFDFYTSNNHKWLYSPKGSAFLYVSDRFIDEIHPLTISLFYGMNFRREFEWQGTKDLTAYIATADAIDLYYDLGGKSILNYNRQLNYEAKKMILENLDTYTTENSMNTVMSTFFLSDKIKINSELSMNLRKYFMNNYKIEIPFMIFDNKVWFRITCQIFNELSDYEKLIPALIDFNKNGIKNFV